MKILAKNIVISAFLTLTVGLFMTAFAQNARAQSVINVTGTTWVGTDSDKDYYEYTFVAGGVLHFKSPSGFYTNGTWQQDGDWIYIQTYYKDTTRKYAERLGQIKGTHMDGAAANVVGRTWTWVADLRNTPPQSTNGAVASLSGTSWNVVETDTEGSRDIFNFLADGTLSYSYQNGSYTNGTWKQDGDSIYIEMNHKFVEYRGRISGSHIEGTASNIKDKHWTWVADLRTTTP